MLKKTYPIHHSNTRFSISIIKSKLLNSYLQCSFLSAFFFSLLLLPVTNTYAASESQQERNAEQHFFAQSFKDFQEESDIAKEEQKQGIFIFFDMVGCPYCLYMKEKVLNQELAQQWYKQHFRSIRLDIHGATEVIDFDGKELTESTFSKRHGVFSTPTMIFFDNNGKEIYRYLKTIKTPERLIAMGESVLVKNK